MKTIQTTLLAALCCTMALTAQAQERTFQRNKVLVEKHTGQGCSACPGADNILMNHLTSRNLLENVAIIRHYNYPSSGNLRLGFHDSLSGIWGINAWPKLQVDRFGFVESDKSDRNSHFFDASVLNAYNAVERRVQTPTYVSLSLDGSTYDPATKKLSVTLSGEVTKDLPYLRANVFITQSGISAYQAGQSDYIHDEVSRDYLMNDVFGEPLTVNTDGTYRVTFEKTLSDKYGTLSTVPEDMNVVVFINSHFNSSADYYSQDFSTCEVHNADVVALLDLPEISPCATPSIDYVNCAFVCTSSTPGAVCHYDVQPCMQTAAAAEGAIDYNAPAFTVTAYAEAPGFAPSAKASRTFSLRDILGEDSSNVNDVNGDGRVTKGDVEALANKLLKK